MINRLPVRQRVRKALILLAFLSVPITMNYLSPYVIIDGAANRILNGSVIMFSLMFLSSLFFGRLWCSWVCPGGGLQEFIEPINPKPVKRGRLDWIKWLIWIPWLALIVTLVIGNGGYHRFDFLYNTQKGISVAGSPDRPILFAYMIYYVVIGLFAGLALLIGRRAGCHTICWMAPFMITGRWIRNWFNWPALRLVADTSLCADCKKCTTNCPMSLDVNGMVQGGAMENAECILCGTCVDNCAKQAIRYSFSSGK